MTKLTTRNRKRPDQLSWRQGQNKEHEQGVRDDSIAYDVQKAKAHRKSSTRLAREDRQTCAAAQPNLRVRTEPQGKEKEHVGIWLCPRCLPPPRHRRAGRTAPARAGASQPPIGRPQPPNYSFPFRTSRPIIAASHTYLSHKAAQRHTEPGYRPRSLAIGGRTDT